jgi:MoaA/NifB/PqqE/SkfB family radical SAM enzyme
MMHPRFFDMITAATGRSARVTTNSNLTLLSDRRAELCVTSGLERIYVSVDGSTAATYETIREGSHYDRVVSNLELLQATKRRLESITPHIHIVMVLMRQNVHELPELVRQAHGWGAESLFVQHLCHDYGEESLPEHYRPMRQFVDEQSLLGDSVRVDSVFAEARGIAEDRGFDLRLPSLEPKQHPPGTPGRSRCDWPWRGAYFSYDGYAMPCCMISTPDRQQLGQSPATPAAVIWNGESYEAFRKQLASDSPPAVCESCSIYRGVF